MLSVLSGRWGFDKRTLNWVNDWWGWVIDCKSKLGFMGAGVNWGKGKNFGGVLFFLFLFIFDRGFWVG